MYVVSKTAFPAHFSLERMDTYPSGPGLKQTNPWLFTDPVAKGFYSSQGRLDLLEEDIRAFVMYDRHWSSEELELGQEIQRLLSMGMLAPAGYFGYLSPHPTVYNSKSEGEMVIVGRKFHFEIFEDIVFVPWLERLTHPGLVGPVRIGRLNTITRCWLCREAFPQMQGLCEKDMAVLRQTLYCPPI